MHQDLCASALSRLCGKQVAPGNKNYMHIPSKNHRDLLNCWATQSATRSGAIDNPYGVVEGR